MATSGLELEEEDGYSSISGATLQKAMKELKENPDTRASMVKELRARIIMKETDLKVNIGPSLASIK